jgi:hypothetical protein
MIRTDLELLKGAIDTHMHALPYIDETTFNIDIFEAAKLAAEAGMDAIVVKNHFGSSCAHAYLANKYAGGCRVIGGVTLNRAQGGFNAEAVKIASEFGAYEGVRPGLIVWMPERDALHGAKILGVPEEQWGAFLTPFKDANPEADLLPEVVDVLKAIAEYDMVLNCCHLSPEEGLSLMRHAKTYGVERMMLTHASGAQVGYNLEQKKQAAELGAYIEESIVAWLPVMGYYGFRVIDAYKDVIDHVREVGPEHFVFGTDCGHKQCPTPVEAMRQMIQLFLDEKFTEEEVRMMINTNPRKLLFGDGQGERKHAKIARMLETE